MVKFNRPAIQTGEMNKPIQFLEYGVAEGPEVSADDPVVLFECMADVYESSSKDIEANSTVSAANLITVKIRETYGHYIPKTHHKFKINHFNYSGEYHIINVSPDTRDKGFIKIVGEHHG